MKPQFTQDELLELYGACSAASTYCIMTDNFERAKEYQNLRTKIGDMILPERSNAYDNIEQECAKIASEIVTTQIAIAKKRLDEGASSYIN